MKKLNNKLSIPLIALVAGSFFASLAMAQDPVSTAPTHATLPLIKAVDVDSHNVVLNRPGIITLILGTGEESQDGARKAGKAMYPFQGRADFQMIVVVDLRDSLATWVPSVATDQMRSNLDKEAIELKPYFLKNGNNSNPRDSSHVVADFNGATCKQVGWMQTSDDLRGVLYGVDGREIKRWAKIEDMNKLQLEVKEAIDALVAYKHAHPGKGGKTDGLPPETQEESTEPPVAQPVTPDKFPPPGSRHSPD